MKLKNFSPNRFLSLILILIFSCQDSDDTLNSKITTEESKSTLIKTTSNRVVNEIPKDIFTLLLEDLKSQGNEEQSIELQTKYELNSTTANYELKPEFKNESPINKNSKLGDYFLYQSHIQNNGMGRICTIRYIYRYNWTGFKVGSTEI
jgi:hypothetical protein